MRRLNLQIMLCATLGLAIAATAVHAENKGDAKKPAGQMNEKAIERRKARFEFIKKEQDKRWAFEDDRIKEERDFADGIRKDKREAERARDEAIAGASDPKAEADARKKYEEFDKGTHKKMDDFRKSLEGKRKAYQESSEKDRKEFLESLNKK